MNILLQAAYNGICLAAENGETNKYSVADVSIEGQSILVKQKMGRPIRLTLSSN
jgi:hypothetical protein